MKYSYLRGRINKYRLMDFLKGILLFIVMCSSHISFSQSTAVHLCPIAEDSGDSLIVHIATANFTDVLFFQFAMAWDNRDLSLGRVDNLNENLVGFNRSSIGALMENKYENTDIIRTSWDDLSMNTVLEDAEVLFSLYFEKLSDKEDLNIEIVREPNFDIEIYNQSTQRLDVVFSGEACGLPDSTSTPTLETQLNQLSIYPNPTSGPINIDFEDYFTGNVFISDVEGKSIFSSKIDAQKRFNFELENLVNGTYILTLQNSDGNKKNYTIEYIKGK